jgi:hypothetical protein
MKKDRIFCLKLSIKDKTYRFSTDKVSVLETISREELEINYLPYLTSISLNESSISYDGSWSVPSVNVTVWDGFRAVASIFELSNYEKAIADVFYINDDGSKVDVFRGYVTDLSFEETRLSFSVRVDDEMNLSEMITVFSFDTFQKSQIFSPSKISVTPYFEVNEQTPWSLVGHESRRLITDFAFGPFNQPVVNIIGMSENGGIVSTSIPDWILDEAPWVEYYAFGDDGQSVQTINKSMEQKYYIYNPLDDTFSIGTREEAKIPVASRERSGYMLATDVCTQKEVNIGFDRRYFPRWSCLQGDVNYLPIANSNPESFSYQYAFNVLSTHEVFAYKKMDNVEDDEERWRVKFYTLEELVGTETYGVPDAIKFRHEKGTALIYYGRPPGEDEDMGPNLRNSNYDYVWVKCDGMRPFDISSSLDIISSRNRFGFIYAGQNGLLKSTEVDGDETGQGGEEENPERYKVKLFHRYEIVEFHKPNDQTGVKTHFYLKLKLHNRGFEPYRHVHAPPRSGTFDIANYEFPHWIKRGDPIKLVNMKWVVEYMDYNISGLTADEVLEIQTLIEYGGTDGDDLLKSLRVDMIKNISDYLIDSGAPGSDKESNDRLVNNASGKFAVAISSKTFAEDGLVRERIEFDTHSIQNYRFSLDKEIPTVSGMKKTPLPIVNQLSMVTALVYPMTYSSSTPRPSMNYMQASNKDVQDNYYYSENDFGMAAAIDFFKSNHYRIMHDPVPENSSDLGSGLPVVYGSVKRAPMTQVISNKALAGSDVTAGDDTYIYASHPCNIVNASDIVVELLDSEGRTPEESFVDGTSQLTDDIASSIIVSPFPKYLDDHHEVVQTAERETDLDGFKTSTSFDGPKRLYSPYYYLVSPITNWGRPMYGVKLRGAEWSYEAGTLDRRYAIRNGVGSSTLYASFSGWVDESGEYTGQSGTVISHPLDVLRHFNDHYAGLTSHGKAKFDENNIAAVKSRTPHHRVSAVIKEPVTVYNFIKSINQEFGIHSYYKNGTIYFTIVDGSFVNYDCPVSESLNLLKGVKEESIGYKDIYNEIQYEYGKNWLSDRYDHRVTLNASNNKYCARAEKVFGGKKQFKVGCNYQRSSGVASEVANRMARILSCKKNQYSLSVKPIKGIVFEPGMFVPLTCSYLGLENQPVMILSVKETETITELKVVHLVDF